MIKTLKKMSIGGKYLHIIKVVYDKPSASILDGETLKAFPIKSGTRQGCLLSPLLFNIVLVSPGQSNQEEKEIKETKVLLVTHYVIVYIETSKALTKILETLNKYSKVAG